MPRAKRRNRSRNQLSVPTKYKPPTPEEQIAHARGEASTQYVRAEAYKEAMLILTHQFVAPK